MASDGTEKTVRIYSDGVFDLFHLGHYRMLEQAKKMFPKVYLIVGVCGDNSTHANKGVTVLTERERYDSVRHCKWVDEVVEDSPWTIDQAFLDKYQIDYVAHDSDPYPSADADDVYKFVKDQGKFLATKRTEGISTSDLIARVLKNNEAFVKRNLKKGFTEADLGVGTQLN